MIRVYVSSVIDASADTVWSRIRDFNGMPLWHPGIADSRIENNEPADKVGCIRHFHTRDGGMIRERLLALSRTTTTAALTRSSRARWGWTTTLPR